LELIKSGTSPKFETKVIIKFTPVSVTSR